MRVSTADPKAKAQACGSDAPLPAALLCGGCGTRRGLTGCDRDGLAKGARWQSGAALLQQPSVDAGRMEAMLAGQALRLVAGDELGQTDGTLFSDHRGSTILIWILLMG